MNNPAQNTNAEYAQYTAAPTSEGQLSELSVLADKQAEAESQVADLTAQLNKAKERLKQIAEQELPEAMDACGLSEFSTRSGLKIKIKETIRASIPKAQTQAALQWLRDHGHGSLIKRVVSLTFGRGEDEKADELRESLLSKGLEPTDKADVHTQTLQAFVREKLEAGEEIPMELFGVFRQREAEINTK